MKVSRASYRERDEWGVETMKTFRNTKQNDNEKWVIK